jgi:hypothetical protein
MFFPLVHSSGKKQTARQILSKEIFKKGVDAKGKV